LKDYSSLDNLGCRMLDLKPYLKKAYDEGYEQGVKDSRSEIVEKINKSFAESCFLDQGITQIF